MYFIVGTFSSLSGRVLEFLESLSVFRYARENIAGSYIPPSPLSKFLDFRKKYPSKLYIYIKYKYSGVFGRLFITKLNYIHIYSDLDDFFFCTSRRAVAKIFRKVIGLKILSNSD